MSNGLAWHPKNIIFSFLEKNPNASPHQVVEYMLDMGHTTWVPTLRQAAWCIRVYKIRTNKKEYWEGSEK